jgi:choline dehydrogenase
MPYVTNGNIYAPVMMLAEKAADLIAGKEPLPPEPIPFYRHDPRGGHGQPGSDGRSPARTTSTS